MQPLATGTESARYGSSAAARAVGPGTASNPTTSGHHTDQQDARRMMGRNRRTDVMPSSSVTDRERWSAEVRPVGRAWHAEGVPDPLAAPAAVSPDAVAAVTDPIFAQALERGAAPGLAFGVISRGELVHAPRDGRSSALDGPAPTSDTVFRIASMTKSFTAATLLRLRDDGLLVARPARWSSWCRSCWQAGRKPDSSPCATC